MGVSCIWYERSGHQAKEAHVTLLYYRGNVQHIGWEKYKQLIPRLQNTNNGV